MQEEMKMATVARGRDKAVTISDPLAQQIVERLLRLPPEKTKRVLELWKLHGQSQDQEERDEIQKVFVEIIHPALVDIPWHPGTIGRLEEGVSGETIRKIKSYRKLVGLRIRNRRIGLAMTQDDLAQKAGIPQSHVCRIEKGMHASTDATIQRVAQALSTAPSELDPASDDER